MVFALFVSFMKNPDFKIGYLNYIGKNLSIYVYILHIAVGKSIDLLAEKNHLWQYAAFKYSKVFIIIILTLFISYLIYQTYMNFSKWHTCRKDINLE